MVEREGSCPAAVTLKICALSTPISQRHDMQTPSTKPTGRALALQRSRLQSFPLHSRSAMGMPSEQGLSMSEGLAATVWPEMA